MHFHLNFFPSSQSHIFSTIICHLKIEYLNYRDKAVNNAPLFDGLLVKHDAKWLLCINRIFTPLIDLSYTRKSKKYLVNFFCEVDSIY